MFSNHPHSWDSVETRVQQYAWSSVNKTDLVISLKDTRKGKYQNVLTDSTTFRYELPGDSIVDALLSDQKTRDKYKIHLFSVQNARDHYLGEWMAVEYVANGRQNIPHVMLRRLAAQDQTVSQSYAVQTSRKRSRNEHLHEQILVDAFPEFVVFYEPDCQTNIGGKMVEGGVQRQWAGNSYTVDFVLASRGGCQRIAVESKYDCEAVDEATLEKCRALRDGSGQRVVVMAGKESCAYLDMGPPMSDSEVWYHDVGALKRGLRL